MERLPNHEGKVISLNDVRATTKEGPTLLMGLISPARSEETIESIAKVEHAAEPLKDPNDIQLMVEYWRSRGKWRDLLLFICGINFGLRVSDLLRLRWCDLVDPETMIWRDEVIILEQKTAKTKKVKKNRHIYINEAVREAAEEYLRAQAAKEEIVAMDDYLFRSESANGSNKNRHMHRNNVERLLKAAAEATGVATRVHVSTHTLRKTFSFWQIESGVDINTLQKILNHSSVTQTLTYAGITADVMRSAYANLRIGGATPPPSPSSSGGLNVVSGA